MRITQVYADVTYTTSSRYSFVDETPADDKDSITGSAAGYALFTFPVFTVPVGQTITDVTIYYRAQDYNYTTTPANELRPALRIGGTNYNYDNNINPTDSFNTYSYSFTTNPRTTAAWTVDDVKGIGANALQQFGVYAYDASPAVQMSMVYVEVNYGTNSLWTIYDGFDDNFRATGSATASDEQRTLTSHDIPLDSYTTGTLELSFDYDASGLDTGDEFFYAYYYDGTWHSNNVAFNGNNSAQTFTVTIPAAARKADFQLRFYYDFNDSSEYVDIDNIEINFIADYTDSDGLDFQLSGDNGSNWSQSYPAFSDNDYSGDGDDNGDGVLDNFSFTVPREYFLDRRVQDTILPAGVQRFGKDLHSLKY